MSDEGKPDEANRGKRMVGISICGAKTRKGGICNQPAMANGRCRYHGGRAASGLQHGNFKHGKHSKALKRLAADIEERVGDPELLDPRRSIAVQESVVARLNEMLDAGDSPEFRENVRRMLAEAFELFKEDAAGGAAKLRELRGYVERGVEQTRALLGVQSGAEAWNRSQTRFWNQAMSGADRLSRQEFIEAMYRVATIITEEVDRDAARRILERADREVCGGVLGIASRGAS